MSTWLPFGSDDIVTAVASTSSRRRAASEHTRSSGQISSRQSGRMHTEHKTHPRALVSRMMRFGIMPTTAPTTCPSVVCSFLLSSCYSVCESQAVPEIQKMMRGHDFHGLPERGKQAQSPHEKGERLPITARSFESSMQPALFSKTQQTTSDISAQCKASTKASRLHVVDSSTLKHSAQSSSAEQASNSMPQTEFASSAGSTTTGLPTYIKGTGSGEVS